MSVQKSQLGAEAGVHNELVCPVSGPEEPFLPRKEGERGAR